MREIEKCLQVGVKFSENRISDLLFADDSVGLAKTGPVLENLINVVNNYSKHWHFEANIRKIAVVIFSKLEVFR